MKKILFFVLTISFLFSNIAAAEEAGELPVGSVVLESFVIAIPGKQGATKTIIKYTVKEDSTVHIQCDYKGLKGRCITRSIANSSGLEDKKSTVVIFKKSSIELSGRETPFTIVTGESPERVCPPTRFKTPDPVN